MYDQGNTAYGSIGQSHLRGLQGDEPGIDQEINSSASDENEGVRQEPKLVAGLRGHPGFGLGSAGAFQFLLNLGFLADLLGGGVRHHKEIERCLYTGGMVFVSCEL